MAAMIGTVKWFNETKGFGFIAPESGGKDIFVHVSAVREAKMTINEGMRVQFEIATGSDGRTSAVNLERLSGKTT